MLTDDEKKEILTRLLNQPVFIKSPASSVLLQYLVNASINRIDVKEATIALDLFGEKFDTEKSNARVRVSVYHLRKKLSAYYENEGKDDSWRIVISKGQYRAEFIRNHKTGRLLGLKDYLIYGLSALLVLIILIAVFILLPPGKPVFWKSFFSNGKPTTLFIGDSFGVMGKTETGSVGWIRDYNINDLEDFYAFCEKHPELKDQLYPANYNYTTGMAADATKLISYLFYRDGKNFAIRFSSNSSYSDIKEGNAVYVGPIKNNNKFIHFFNEGNPRFKIRNGQLIFSGDRLHAPQTFGLTLEGLDFEYAIVSRLPGPEHTEQFIFFSDHDIGVKATVEYFTDTDSLKAFCSRYLKGKNVPFTALFETRGIERTNMSLKPIVVSEIEN